MGVAATEISRHGIMADPVAKDLDAVIIKPKGKDKDPARVAAGKKAAETAKRRRAEREANGEVQQAPSPVVPGEKPAEEGKSEGMSTIVQVCFLGVAAILGYNQLKATKDNLSRPVVQEPQAPVQRGVQRPKYTSTEGLMTKKQSIAALRQ